ncbi:MAG: hypothetical protein ABIJ17_02040 [Patescibacteria group bacterium]
MFRQYFSLITFLCVLLAFPACDSCNPNKPDEILEYSSIFGTYQRDPADITNDWDSVYYVYEIFDPEKNEQYPQADYVTMKKISSNYYETEFPITHVLVQKDGQRWGITNHKIKANDAMIMDINDPHSSMTTKGASARPGDPSRYRIVIVRKDVEWVFIQLREK